MADLTFVGVGYTTEPTRGKNRAVYRSVHFDPGCGYYTPKAGAFEVEVWTDEDGRWLVWENRTAAMVVTKICGTCKPIGTDSRDWVNEAACAGLDLNDWFPERGQSQQKAAKVCATCPVRVECAEWAKRNDIRHGIWGGWIYSYKKRAWREIPV